VGGERTLFLAFESLAKNVFVACFG